MVGRHHRHNEHGFGWTLGVGDGQEGLVYCGSWGRKELDTIEPPSIRVFSNESTLVKLYECYKASK